MGTWLRYWVVPICSHVPIGFRTYGDTGSLLRTGGEGVFPICATNFIGNNGNSGADIGCSHVVPMCSHVCDGNRDIFPLKSLRRPAADTLPSQAFEDGADPDLLRASVAAPINSETVLEDPCRGRLPGEKVPEPGLYDFLPAVELVAGKLDVSGLWRDLPPGFLPPVPVNGLGPELLPVPPDPLQVRKDASDGPEASAPRGVLEIVVVVRGPDEDALSREPLEPSGVREPDVILPDRELELDPGRVASPEGGEFGKLDAPEPLEGLVEVLVVGGRLHLRGPVLPEEGEEGGGLPDSLGAFEDDHVVELAPGTEGSRHGRDKKVLRDGPEVVGRFGAEHLRKKVGDSFHAVPIEGIEPIPDGMEEVLMGGGLDGPPEDPVSDLAEAVFFFDARGHFRQLDGRERLGVDVEVLVEGVVSESSGEVFVVREDGDQVVVVDGRFPSVGEDQVLLPVRGRIVPDQIRQVFGFASSPDPVVRVASRWKVQARDVNFADRGSDGPQNSRHRPPVFLSRLVIVRPKDAGAPGERGPIGLFGRFRAVGGGCRLEAETLQGQDALFAFHDVHGRCRIEPVGAEERTGTRRGGEDHPFGSPLKRAEGLAPVGEVDPEDPPGDPRRNRGIVVNGRRPGAGLREERDD